MKNAVVKAVLVLFCGALVAACQPAKPEVTATMEVTEAVVVATATLEPSVTAETVFTPTEAVDETQPAPRVDEAIVYQAAYDILPPEQQEFVRSQNATIDVASNQFVVEKDGQRYILLLDAQELIPVTDQVEKFGVSITASNSLTSTQIEYWRTNEESLGELPDFMDTFSNKGEDSLANFWSNLLKSRNLENLISFTYVDNKGNEQTQTVDVSNVILLQTVGPEGFNPLDTPLPSNYLEDHHWTDLGVSDPDNPQIKIMAAFRLRVQNNALVIEYFTYSGVTKQPNINQTFAIYDFLNVAAQSLSEGKTPTRTRIVNETEKRGTFNTQNSLEYEIFNGLTKISN